MQILITPRDSATYVRECTRQEAEALAAAGPVIVVEGDNHIPWEVWSKQNPVGRKAPAKKKA